MFGLQVRPRRFAGIATLVLAIAVVAPFGRVLAATTVPLHEPHQGTVAECGTQNILWHFVLNKLDAGTASGSVTATFLSAGGRSDVGEPVGIGKVQHFWIETSGSDRLLGASASVSDQSGSPMLVLSHWECGGATPNTPPSNPPSIPPSVPPTIPPSNPPSNGGSGVEGGSSGSQGTVPAPRSGTAASSGGPAVVALPDTAMSGATSGLLLAIGLILAGGAVSAVAVRSEVRSRRR